MPAALPLIAGAFLAAGSIATAIGLGTAIVVAGLTITWAAALTITGVALMAVAFLARKTPKPDSSGQQLNQKLDPQAPIPIVYGRTASGGFITSRNTFGKKNSLYGIVTVLSVGAIGGIESYQAGDYPIGFDRNPAVQTATAVTVGGYSGSSKLYKGKLFQRWVNGQIPATLTPASASGYPITGGLMSAVAYVATVYEYNTDAFPQGLPASMWVLRGQKVYDPRKDSTYPGGSGSHRRDVNSTWEYSDNPYLCALNWTLGRYENGKRLFGIGARWEEVDVASFVAGANIAAANNWRVGGQVVSTDDKYAVLTSILAAGSGSPIARGAQIACSVNAPKVATLTLGREDIIGEVEIQSSTSLRDRQNTIVPRYREESQQWEIISGERVSAPIYVEEDRGQTKTVEIEMPLVQQAAQAHQLAAYELVNSREFLTFTVKTKLRMLAARVGDAITVSVSEISANSKKCVVIGREFNPSDATVTLSLKSETDGKHAFALGQSQVAPPSAKLDGYDPSNPGAPEETAWSITDTKISNGTNTIPAIVVSGAVDDPYAVTVIAEYRPLGSSVWLGWGEHPRDTKRIEITAVTDKTAYEVALSYRSNRGVVGDRLILSTTAGSLVVNYGNVSGTPTKLGDINSGEGGKLGGIEPGANVGGTIGVDIKNPDGSLFTGIDPDQVNQLIDDATAGLASDVAKAKTDLATARSDIDRAVSDGTLGDDQLRTSINNLSINTDAAITETKRVLRLEDKAISDRVVTVESQMADTAPSGLKSSIATVSGIATTAVGKADAVAGRTDTVEAQLRGDAASGLKSSIASVSDTATTAVGKADAVAGRTDTVEAQLRGDTASGLSGTLARVSETASGAASNAGAAVQTANEAKAQAGPAAAWVSTNGAATVNAVNGIAAAKWTAQAVTPGGVAQISLSSSTNNGGAVEIVGNTTFRGNLNVGPDSGQRIKITSNSIIIYDSNNVTRVKLGLF